MKHHELFRASYSQLLGLMARGVTSHPPLPPYYTGYEGGTLYDWDQYFETILQAYVGYPCDYASNGVRIFLGQQDETGFIRRSLQPGGWVAPNFKHKDHVKPFLAQILWLVYLQQRTLDWLEQENLYPRLKKYLMHWLDTLDVRGGGLSVWRHAGHSGMDNHYERAGEIRRPELNEPMYCEGVDLNAYLVRETQAMARIAEVLGKEDDRAHFDQAAVDRAEAIRQQLWDDEEGIFYDRHAQEDRPIKVKHVGIFATLWAGIATEEQARRLVQDHLLNEREFWRPWPIPALAATEPTYIEGFLSDESKGCCSWRGTTWLPTNYYTFHGLRRYGFHDAARQLAERTFDLFDRGRFNEYYTSDTGVGTGRKPFWGWTGLALFMEPELELNADPTALEASNNAIERMRRWIIAGSPAF